MKTRLPFSVFFFTGLLYFHFISFAQDIHFTIASGAKDDISGTVGAITQDMQGFLWLATDNGLYKYDGH